MINSLIKHDGKFYWNVMKTMAIVQINYSKIFMYVTSMYPNISSKSDVNECFLQNGSGNKCFIFVVKHNCCLFGY